MSDVKVVTFLLRWYYSTRWRKVNKSTPACASEGCGQAARAPAGVGDLQHPLVRTLCSVRAQRRTSSLACG